MVAFKKTQLRKFVVLPCCLLVLNVFEEIIVYKSQKVTQPHLRVLVLLFVFAFGISSVAFIISPLLEKFVQKFHRTSYREGGVMGEIIFIFLVFSGLFLLYYTVYINGAETILPESWKNS